MKVTVDYLFSNRDLIGSKLIVYGTKHLAPYLDPKDVPSHMAVLVNERWVHESTIDSGVSVISYDKWLEKHREVKRIPCTNRVREYKEIKNIFQTIKDKDYDHLGVIYLGVHLASNKYFNTTIPEINKWEDPNKYFCCEAAEKISGVKSTSMKAPVQLMIEWSDGEIKKA